MLITNKFIFIHIPKTAGTSIISALWSYKLNIDPKIQQERHTTLRQLEPRLDTTSRFTFAFVRNPWDRILSLYSHVIQKGKVIGDKLYYKDIGFNRWVIEELEQMQLTWGSVLTQQGDWISPGVDFIGRFENVEDDFKKVCKKLDLRTHPRHKEQRYWSKLNRKRAERDQRRTLLRKRNTTKHEHYTKVYNDEAKSKVAELFAQDIEMFNHTFEDQENK